jgi:hypothetical protein
MPKHVWSCITKTCRDHNWACSSVFHSILQLLGSHSKAPSYTKVTLCMKCNASPPFAKDLWSKVYQTHVRYFQFNLNKTTETRDISHTLREWLTQTNNLYISHKSNDHITLPAYHLLPFCGLRSLQINVFLLQFLSNLSVKWLLCYRCVCSKCQVPFTMHYALSQCEENSKKEDIVLYHLNILYGRFSGVTHAWKFPIKSTLVKPCAVLAEINNIMFCRLFFYMHAPTFLPSNLPSFLYLFPQSEKPLLVQHLTWQVVF